MTSAQVEAEPPTLPTPPEFSGSVPLLEMLWRASLPGQHQPTKPLLVAHNHNHPAACDIEKEHSGEQQVGSRTDQGQVGLDGFEMHQKSSPSDDRSSSRSRSHLSPSSSSSQSGGHSPLFSRRAPDLKIAPVPLPQSMPSDPNSNVYAKYDERNSFSEAGTFPYHPDQVCVTTCLAFFRQ